MNLATCIMPTANRRRFVPAAIRLFLEQDFDEKELIIVDDGDDSIADLVPTHPQIRYIALPKPTKLGSKRNIACESALGEFIVHWDDDDWHAPWRLRYQVSALERGNLDVCGLDDILFVDGAKEEAWEFTQPKGVVPWLCGATLCYRKSFWNNNPFPNISRGEDSRFIFAARRAPVGILEDNRFLIARIHRANSHPKRTSDARWKPLPYRSIQSIIGSDWDNYFSSEDGLPIEPAVPKQGTALITAASGIGDILRATPLIRVADRLGFEVDVLIRPDDVAAEELLRDARDIRRLVVYQYPRGRFGSGSRPSDLADVYDFASFTFLSSPLSPLVKARRYYPTNLRGRPTNDIARLQAIAEQLGWQRTLPAPFAMKSTRRFNLEGGTIAIHPGCKASWPWKKWHGFDELSERFEHVVLVGTPSDLDNSRTYFGRPFRWPAHVQSFIGELSLRDTAALLSQCAAVVSVDSGLMHLSVALRVPTFGVFGITSPSRECIPSPFMFPITKGLPCEPDCRLRSWGRRDCEFHLLCLKSLTASEVIARMARNEPRLSFR